MRKVIVSMNVTLDGFMAGSKGELDWHFPLWNNEMLLCACEQLRSMDTILMGRITYQAMADFWPYTKTFDSSKEEREFAYMMNAYSKIVFSRTLSFPRWKNTKLAKKIKTEEILQLKRQSGRDIVLYGSGSIVKKFIQLNLIDEFWIWVHPVMIGEGMPFFEDVCDQVKLKLLKTKTFRSGVTVLYYQSIGRKEQIRDINGFTARFKNLLKLRT
jgi:dihydrofolate reductase